MMLLSSLFLVAVILATLLVQRTSAAWLSQQGGEPRRAGLVGASSSVSFPSFTTRAAMPPLSRHELLLRISSSLPSDWDAAAAMNDNNGKEASSPVRSVNCFISRVCNYSCKFCFHTQKNTNHLDLQMGRAGLAMLQKAGTEKINFAGGEPFLKPHLLGELCRSAHHLGLAVSIVSNGSLVTQKWMEEYGNYVDVLAVSCDSFVPATNAAIGRGGDANNRHVDRVLGVRDLCNQHGIKFKINTVVCRLNWEEDMRSNIQLLNPERWKVFQCLILKGENAGGPGELRDARSLTISANQFQSFVDRHNNEFSQIMIPEPNDVMQNSYLLLDENMCFLDCSDGGKVPSESILKVGVHRALEQAGFDLDMFEQRGGIYDWKRDRKDNSLVDAEPLWSLNQTLVK